MYKIENDPTNAELHPGDQNNCQGNGNHPGFEICCDNCDWFLLCFPQYDRKEIYYDREQNQ
jgi:hypothetical protein